MLIVTVGWIVAALLLTTFTYSAGIRIGAERLQALQDKQNNIESIKPAVNYVNGVILPDPTDPRWELYINPWRLQLGNIYLSLCTDKTCNIYIGTLDKHSQVAQNTAAYDYCNAVDMAWHNRKSMESIESADFPQKDPQLQLKGV